MISEKMMTDIDKISLVDSEIYENKVRTALLLQLVFVAVALVRMGTRG